MHPLPTTFSPFSTHFQTPCFSIKKPFKLPFKVNSNFFDSINFDKRFDVHELPDCFKPVIIKTKRKKRRRVYNKKKKKRGRKKQQLSSAYRKQRSGSHYSDDSADDKQLHHLSLVTTKPVVTSSDDDDVKDGHRLNCINIFHCKHCSYKSPRLGDLMKHERVHTNTRPFKCSYCSRSFKQSSHLRVHLRLYKKDDASYPYTCSGKKILKKDVTKQVDSSSSLPHET